MDTVSLLQIVPYKFIAPKNGGHLGVYFPLKYFSKIAKVVSVSVKSNEEDNSLQCQRQHILSTGKSRYFNFFLIFKLKKIIKENEIQLIIIEHPYLAWLGFALHKITKIKWVIRSHNIEYLRFKDLGKPWWKILKGYEIWAYNHANAVWCISDDDKFFLEKINIQTPINTMPYGTELQAIPMDKLACKKQICKELQLNESTKLILFNGSLGYEPNRLGLDAILEKINPYLLENLTDYKIIICGSQLPTSYIRLKEYATKNIIYCGFVDDISLYFKGADLFLNPIVGGGGIKTKLVESLAYNTPTISSQHGAIGINKEVVGNMLHIIPNYDWDLFAKKIIEIVQSKNENTIPEKYYEYYNWANITKRILMTV